MLHWKSRVVYAVIAVLALIAAVGGDIDGWSWH
jgi:hypothetical protein